MTVLLAIDPAATTGIVVLTIERSPKLKHHEIYKSASRTVRPTFVVQQLVEQYGIERAAIEDQFLFLNPDTLKKVARRAGQWEEACLNAGLQVSWVNPRTWQTAILGDKLGRSRAQIDAAMRMVAHQDTGIKLSSDESAAWCIGRYVAVEVCQGRINAEYSAQRKTRRKSRRVGKSTKNKNAVPYGKMHRNSERDRRGPILSGLLP